MLSRKGRLSHQYDGPKEGFQPLLTTGIPSPNLPALIIQDARRSDIPLKWRLLRLLGWTFGVGVIFWFANAVLSSEKPPSAISYLSTDGEAYEIVGADRLPEEPSPILVSDQRGRSRWTISIPPQLEFPLRPPEYGKLCRLSDEISTQVDELKHPSKKGHHHTGHTSYYHVDPNFMDVTEAEEHGMLPGSSDTPKKGIWGDKMVDPSNDGMSEDVVTMQGGGKGKFCEKTLTFVMETGEAGMGHTLMGLWMSYGLAQKEGRSFFIDDTHWAWGNFRTFFDPPPKPACLPPPRTQMLPCPHQAQHLLVSAGSVRWTFGHKFHEEYENPRKMGVFRIKETFEFMRTGYEALFHLKGEDGTDAISRIDNLNTTVRGKGGLEIGVHVRHGDRHPLEYKYQKSYLPLEKYVDAARDFVIEAFGNNSSTNTDEDFPSEVASKMLLASDDPDVYDKPEVSQAIRAQTKLVLASKLQLDASSKKPGAADDNLGFEGGFFSDVFWSQFQNPVPPPEGSPRPSKRQFLIPHLHARTEDHRHPTPQALEWRGLVGRAYLMDLAVLGQSDRIVCGVSSNTCRILAVMMGWERAIEKGWWKSVDGQFDWKDIEW